LTDSRANEKRANEKKQEKLFGSRFAASRLRCCDFPADKRSSVDFMEKSLPFAALWSNMSREKSEMLVPRLVRFLSRKAPRQIPRGILLIWESELRAIASEALEWSVETGGDLFGRWDGVPTVFLATKAGPKAQRNHAHFRLDIEYLRKLSETMASDWALRYFGDWHSHHRLGLSAPSGGDRRRILNIARRNRFSSMAETIVTLEDGHSQPTIRVHPWSYDLSSKESEPFPLHVKVLPGISPIRQVLLGRRVLPEQELLAWEKIPLHRIRIGLDDASPSLEPATDPDAMTREQTLSQLAEALQKASGSPVEHHSTSFGCVLVAKLDEPYYLAFALGSAWPMRVLEVYRLNRNLGTAEPIKSPAGLVAPDIQGILKVLEAAKEDKTKSNVDR
jgi:hypothetical protein